MSNTRTISSKMRYLLDAIKEHATTNYNRDGWDLVIETMSESDMVEHLGHDMWTVREAIRIVHSHVADYAAYRDEIQATAF
jgi:hypothetical protein